MSLNRRPHERSVNPMPPGPAHPEEPLGCIKKAYDTPAEATAAGRGTPYRCRFCGRYHLTTKAPKSRQGGWKRRRT